jgi:hypothetical protein
MAISVRPRTPLVRAGEVVILEGTVTPPPGDPNRPYVATWSTGGHYGEFRPVQGPTLVTFSTPAPNEVEVAATVYQRGQQPRVIWETAGVPPGPYTITLEVFQLDDPSVMDFRDRFLELRGHTIGSASTVVQVTRAPAEPTTVSMRRADSPPTADQALWTVIRRSTNALAFNNYARFMDIVMCGAPDTLGLSDIQNPTFQERRDMVKHRLRLPFPDTDAYRQLKVATEVFVMLNCGVSIENHELNALDQIELDAERRRHYRALGPGDIEIIWNQLLEHVATDGIHDPVRTLPYLAIIRRKLQDVAVVRPNRSQWLQEEEATTECLGILMGKLTNPCLLELIWSYWHEEGMLVQTMNAITWRFQNRRGRADRDPLALLEIDPLRPLNNFIWGHIQDEQHRLTVARRAYEYDHHYGLALLGKAVPTVRGADSRTRFLEAFHYLLHRCSFFHREDDDTTVVADGFPVLNALKEVHLLLTQGAHNQYGDLPWTARQEMLMQEWMLARPEMREFLPSRIMVDYPEPWMDRVETMKTLQGWTDTSVMHFRDLGVFGEQILLSVRFGAWPSVIESQHAANWARYWRPEIQGYIHGYRAVTGVDLSERVDTTMPAVLLQQRLTLARGAGAALPNVVLAPVPSRVGQLPAPRTTR